MLMSVEVGIPKSYSLRCGKALLIKRWLIDRLSEKRHPTPPMKIDLDLTLSWAVALGGEPMGCFGKHRRLD